MAGEQLAERYGKNGRERVAMPELWGLSESTLRKAVSYGKIAPGVDARKYGKQWIVTREAMSREYGEQA